jgi:hypothetical protein
MVLLTDVIRRRAGMSMQIKNKERKGGTPDSSKRLQGEKTVRSSMRVGLTLYRHKGIGKVQSV